MSYNTDFWVLAGTTAPVLGLAGLLAAGATIQANLKLQSAADLELDVSARPIIDAQLHLVRLPYAASILSAFINMLVLTWALIAAAQHDDPVPMTLVTVLLVLSVVLLWVQVYFVAAISFARRSPGFIKAALSRERRRSRNETDTR